MRVWVISCVTSFPSPRLAHAESNLSLLVSARFAGVQRMETYGSFHKLLITAGAWKMGSSIGTAGNFPRSLSAKALVKSDLRFTPTLFDSDKVWLASAVKP